MMCQKTIQPIYRDVTYVPYPCPYAFSWYVSKEKEVIKMHNIDNKKVIIPTYCKSIKTNRTIASFSVLGDNGSFYNVPTYYKKVKVPIHSRIVCGSDGIFDVIHDEDEILLKKI